MVVEIYYELWLYEYIVNLAKKILFWIFAVGFYHEWLQYDSIMAIEIKFVSLDLVKIYELIVLIDLCLVRFL